MIVGNQATTLCFLVGKVESAKELDTRADLDKRINGYFQHLLRWYVRLSSGNSTGCVVGGVWKTVPSTYIIKE